MVKNEERFDSPLNSESSIQGKLEDLDPFVTFDSGHRIPVCHLIDYEVYALQQQYPNATITRFGDDIIISV